MGSLGGKVVLITGSARGQGRSHTVRSAEEGVDIIGVDICAQVATVKYPMATKDDRVETVSLVEATGRRMVSAVADVRDQAALRSAVAVGVAELGRLDIVLANTGVMFQNCPREQDDDAFTDAVDIMLTGMWNTLRATVAC